MIMLPVFLLIIVTVLRLNLKPKIADRTGNDGTKNNKIRVPLKYFSNLWRTLEMSLIDYEINFILTLPERCYIIEVPIVSQQTTITHTKLYVPVAISSTQDNGRLLE